MVQKKIKILYTIPNFDTAGSGKVVYDLMKNLDRTIFEPEICCFHTKGSFLEEIERVSQTGIVSLKKSGFNACKVLVVQQFAGERPVPVTVKFNAPEPFDLPELFLKKFVIQVINYFFLVTE